METCQLDECDFLETRFKQYATEDEFYTSLSDDFAFAAPSFTSSRNERKAPSTFLMTPLFIPNNIFAYRGVILYFVHKIIDFNVSVSSAPHYVYMPLDIPIQKETVDTWIKTQKEELKSEYSLYETQYWYLDELSCVLVKRNKEWFRNSVSKIEDTWKTIERERVEGYEHRSAKKRFPKPEDVHDGDRTSQFIRNLPTNNSICLIKLDE